MEFWIDIQAGDGTKYGAGPIGTATGWETTARLDRAGRFSFEMPAGDPQAALCQAKREAWCWAIVGGAVTLIGAGIIDQLETQVNPAGAPMLAVGGDDLLRELTYRSVGFMEIVTPAGQASPDALDDIMAEAPGTWSLDTVGGYGATENDVYAKFAGETVLAALNKVGEHTGEHFRLGSGKQVVWLQDELTDSGVRAMGQADPGEIGDNDDLCLITELSESQGSYDLCTRLFAFGAGNGQARVSLADTSVGAHAGYVLDQSNPKGANLTHSAAFTQYGQIERFLSWKEISPISNTDADIESAANELYAAAYQYLSRYCQVQTSYRLAVTKLEKPVLPGQKIRVIWREVVNGFRAVDIDADLTVLETTTRLSAAGLRTVAMQVSTIDAWPQTIAEIIAGQLEEARLMDGHPQTFAGYYSEGLGNFNVSPTYSAMARFKFDDRITRLVSAKLRFRTDAFEATVTAAASAGGSSPSSSSGGGSSQSSSSQGSHSHAVGVTVVGGPASASYDVYWDPDNHRFHLPSVGEGEDDQQGQTSQSGGSHSHNVSVPNHSHSVTIPGHTHPLTYGIVRSGTYPGGVTIWVNGVNRTFELTDLTSLGTATGSTGMVEVELANILNLDFRREHTIELKCGSGYGTILNAALRCFVIVQAILAQPTAPTSPVTPAEPTVAVVATADGWRVTWLAVSGAESYRLYGNTTGVDAGAEEITLTTSREVLVPYGGGISYFAATAIAGTNESDIGPWATDTSAPANPTWVSHVFQAEGHFVHWYHPDLARVENFVLYRNTSGVEAGATLIDTLAGTNTSAVIPYAAGGDWFGVKAVSYAGISSAVVWFGPYDPTPGVPIPTAQMVEFGGFGVSWAAVVRAGRYEVEGATDDEGTGAALKWSGQALYTPTLAETGVAWFRVRAQGYDDTYSDWSGWVTDENPPPQPVLAMVGGIQSVSVGLAASDPSHSSPGFSHYLFERADGSGGEGATTLDSHALYASFPRVFSQTTGITKYFRLTPYDWAGNEGTPTAWTAATPAVEGATVQDKFDGYGGAVTTSNLESLYWLKVLAMDEPINTTAGTVNDTWTDFHSGADLAQVAPLAEGAKAIQMKQPVAGGDIVPYYYYGTPIDLSAEQRFTDTDYVLVVFSMPQATYDNWPAGSPRGSIRFADSSLHHANLPLIKAGDTWDDPDVQGVVAGLNFLKFRKDQLYNVHPDIDWSDIGYVEFNLSMPAAAGGYSVTVDDLRIVKADPDDAETYSDTGPAWDQAASTGTDFGQWHIYPGNRTSEPAKPFAYGQIKTAASPDRWYASYKPLLSIGAIGTIQAGLFHKENGKSGLAFFAQSFVADQWTMYAVEADNVGDTIKLVKWVGGTRSEIASATFPFISAGSGTGGQTIWVGADFSQYDTDGGRIKVYASTVEGNLIQAGNLKISVQDTAVGSGGTVGLLSNQANVRFVNFVAGSPAHAEVADVALALDGPIIAGATRRVHYNRDNNHFEYSDDGTTFTPVAVADEKARVSKLYESDFGAAALSAAAGGDLTATGTITLADDKWIGLGSAAGRIEFDNQTVDEVNILDARLGVKTSAPLLTLDVDGGQALRRADVTLANGLNSNITVGDRSFIRILGPTGAFSIGGFTGGVDGQLLYVFNSVQQTMTIVNSDASSSAANRILTLTGANVVLRATNRSFATFVYVSASALWMLVSTN